MSYTYPFARPALSVDIVVFGISDNTPSLLVIQRGIPPFKDQWALPGGFVRIDETLEQAARRELKEETGMTKVHLEQLSAFSSLDRDPRERTLTVAYFAFVKATDFNLLASTDAQDAKWISLYQDDLKLAFDHNEIVDFAKNWLIGKLYREHLVLKVLPEVFTLTQVQQLYEGVLNTALDKRNFRKQILASGLVKKTKKKLTNVAYRSPLIYSLSHRALQQNRKSLSPSKVSRGIL